MINNLQTGGAEVLLSNLLPVMKHQGVDASIYLLQAKESYLEKELVQKGIAVYASGRESVYSPVHLTRLARHLHDAHYDLINVHLFPAQLWVAMAVASMRRRPVLVTTEHSTYNRRRKPWFRPLDRWMYGRYQAIACISQAAAEELSNWLPELEGKIAIIPNGIDLERFRKADALDRKDITEDGDAPLLLFVARFQPQKDHETLLRAMVNVPGAELVLVGDGPLRKDMEMLCRQLGIDNRVHFLGNRQDVPELIKMADIYVHSSRWEGFGLAALEAMAGGLPVIASRVPGMEDIVEGTGLLFEPGDHMQLAGLINRLLRERSFREKLIQAGRERAVQYGIQKCAGRYIEFYRQALSQND